MKSHYPSKVFLVDGRRTPFLKARGSLNPFSAADLAVDAGRQLLLKNQVPATEIDEVIVGCMIPSPVETNIARVIALRLGCGNLVPGWTVQRNCASGLQSIDNAATLIANNRADLILAGGTDAMSHAPIMWNADMANWLGAWLGAKSAWQRSKVLLGFRLKFLAPVIALLKGLTDPISGLSMGQTAENLAYRFAISREQMDSYALRSHQRLAVAMEAGYLSEMIPLYDQQGNVYQQDTGLRPNSSMEKLGQLKPFFDKKYGEVTAGNSSQVTDGAAMLLLASEKALKKYHLTPRARVIDVSWAALDPAQMGLGPVYASAPLLLRHRLKLSDIDFWEINEAFAAQVLACLKAMADPDFCQQAFDLKTALGELDQARLNVDGGAIALGHPIGASGARITLHLMNVLERHQATRGIATLCVGGGQGGALLIERMA